MVACPSNKRKLETLFAVFTMDDGRQISESNSNNNNNNNAQVQRLHLYNGHREHRRQAADQRENEENIRFRTCAYTRRIQRN